MSGAGCYFVSCCALLYLLLQSPITSELVEWSLCLGTELTARRWRRLPVAAKYERFSVYVCALALAMCITRSTWKIGSVVCVCIRSCRALLVCIEIAMWVFSAVNVGFLQKMQLKAVCRLQFDAFTDNIVYRLFIPLFSYAIFPLSLHAPTVMLTPQYVPITTLLPSCFYQLFAAK